MKSGGKQSQARVKRTTSFHVAFLFGLFLDPEDIGNIFLRNFDELSTDYTALYEYLRRYEGNSS
jgi:hypothetical protein